MGQHGISTLHSINRHRGINAVATEKSGTPGTIANCKLDTHADTCVAGPKFQVDELTGEYCDVAPFSNEYKPMQDVPIVNASMAFTNDAGTTVILRFNQVLWYGTKLNVSLINPNQIRHYGLAVSDDPTDKDRFFGITTEDIEIPFEMKGTTVFFQSRVPTRWEIENCRTIELTQDHPWNPNEVNIAKVTTRNQKDDMESETYQQVCAFPKLPCVTNCVNDCKCYSNIDSGLSVFDECKMIP